MSEAGKVYFQWQNNFLRQTIYPLREMKLRDFLVYFYEIETWDEYRNKSLEDIPQEVEAYRKSQSSQWQSALEQFRDLRDYFLTADVSEAYAKKFPELDLDILEKINQMHREFEKHFSSYRNPRKERFFLTTRVGRIEQLRKDVEHRRSELLRKMRNMGPSWAKYKETEADAKRLLEVTLVLVDHELQLLYDFLAAFSRVEKRREELAASRKLIAKELEANQIKLAKIQKKRSQLENQRARVSGALARMRDPGAAKRLKDYFLDPDVEDDFRSLFPEADQGFIAKINLAHKQFIQWLPENSVKAKAVVERLFRIYTQAWQGTKGVAKRMANLELEKIRIFADILDFDKLSPESLQTLIQQTEEKLNGLSAELDTVSASEQQFETSIKTAVDVINAPDEDYLADPGGSQAVTIRDIARGKVQVYKQELNQLGQQELLEAIWQKFSAHPEKYPLWLQYMVIHFSGMRYQSAHGSWADPRDLLASLVEKAVEKELERMDNGAIEALCQERIQLYDQEADEEDKFILEEVDGVQPPALAITEDPQWAAKAAHHLRTLRAFKLRVKAIASNGGSEVDLYRATSGGGVIVSGERISPVDVEFIVDPKPLEGEQQYYRILEYPQNPQIEGLYLRSDELTFIADSRKRKALLDLRVDEETYAVENELTDQQVLAELETLKGELDLPEWMWNEIVRLTDLRLKEVKSASWEEMSTKERDDRQDAKWRAYRQLMDQWKRVNLTGWRKEHDRRNRLIVTRAVCNEVAEHIQHLRGISPPGGLTAKPEWYLRLDRQDTSTNGSNRPLFVKPTHRGHFKEGASIFWLRFVNSEPNAWRIALPIFFKDGQGLLTPALKIERGNIQKALRRSLKLAKAQVTQNPTEWVYFQDNQSRYKRYRYTFNKNKQRTVDDQWLRWMHEATIAKVAETADGPTVLTFETALPYEDKRRSTIGVFKHTVNELKYNVSPRTFIGSFVGYIPPGDIPLDDLRKMLDWKKILRRDDIPDDEIQRYWQKVVESLTSSATPMSSNGKGGKSDFPLEGTRMEAAPTVSKFGHKEWIRCYTLDLKKGRAKVYQPRVELKRGLRLWVAKDGAQKVAGMIYYPVLQCELETRAQGLFVRSREVIEVPAVKSSVPVVAKEKLQLLSLKRANQSGFPIIDEYYSKDNPKKKKLKVQLPQGAAFRVSSVHRVTATDKGNGIIRGDGKSSSYLIVECPMKSSVVGLFVATDLVEQISEEAYEQSAILPEEEELKDLRVKVSPRKGKPAVFLFKNSSDGSKVRSTGDTLPGGTPLVVAPVPEFERGKEYYRIVESEIDPAFEGMYVNVKDVALQLEIIEEIDSSVSDSLPVGAVV